MKCNYPEESPYCAFHYNGICTRDHNYECPALAMKNLSHGEMVQIAEGKKNKTPRYIDANKLIDMAMHEGAYGYVDVHDIYNAPTADVVAVVRCRDCEYWDTGSPMATVIPPPCRCRLRREDYGMTAEDFCSYGRKKTDAEIH